MIMISTHTMMRVGRNPVLILFFSKTITYSSVPNRRVGQNKYAGGKILRKH
jgi:hypothetical protein